MTFLAEYNTYNTMKRLLTALALALGMTATAAASHPATPKREFRGGWMHTVFQGQYLRKGTVELQNI